MVSSIAPSTKAATVQQIQAAEALDISLLDQLPQLVDLVRATKGVTLQTLLPLCLNLKGKPYSLRDHFPFEPFFLSRMPQTLVGKTGRQTGKTASSAAKGVLSSNCIPYFSTLYITPLYEMIRRFSNNYVRPFIETSPLRAAWTSTTTENSVLQRSFRNYSRMIFSFAFLDVDRTRGISADRLAIDEYQDMDPSFLPIIRETMAASPWKLTELTGTPKTLENGLETAWLNSSRGEWVIPCEACHYENVPALSHDLRDMIGPWHPDISEERPGVICARASCRRPIFPRKGRWILDEPELHWESAGYHIPQIILPMHYADPDAWKIILAKQAGKGDTPPYVFYNEVCGESYDLGARLVTVTDLRQAARLGPNTIQHATRDLDKYIYRVLAVDWGGGGREGLSFTTAAVLGMLPDGRIECIYGWRSLTPHDYLSESRQILNLLGIFRCSHLIHDYSGAGEGRHLFIIHSGYPQERTIACSYIRAASGAIMRFIPATQAHPRDHYRIDKARSLVLTCTLIKSGVLSFFSYDHRGAEERGLLHDFLALVEDKVASRTGSDIYTIIRDEKLCDDFAQAVNIGCMSLFYLSGQWPNLAETARLQVSQEALEAAHPLGMNVWEDEVGRY